MSEAKVNLDKPVLRHRQVKELMEELSATEREARDPDVAKSFRTGTTPYDKGITGRTVRHAKKMLAEQAPDPNLDAETKDSLARKEHELRTKIREGMPTQYEMRANPPGTVSKHMKWERTNKKDIMRWKHARVRLEPGNDDPDLANVEILRHPGHRWVPTGAYREGFDKMEWGEVAAASPEGFDAKPEPDKPQLGNQPRKHNTLAAKIRSLAGAEEASETS